MSVQLDTELKAHLSKGTSGLPMIHHPLVVGIYHPMMNQQYNETLKNRREMIRVYTKIGKWSDIVFMHERPYRVEAFANLANNEIIDPEVAASLWLNVWTDQEFNHENMPLAARFFSEYQNTKVFKDSLSNIDVADNTAFPVFRGASVYELNAVGSFRKVIPLGFSWTLNRDTAEWFANRFGEQGKVAVRFVRKADLVAFTNDRGESEVIVRQDVLEQWGREGVPNA